MKNIWIINQYTGSSYHGMNYRSYYLAKEFIKENKVTIFSGSYSHLFVKEPKIKGLFTEENIEGINYIWVKTSKYKTSKSLARIVNMLIFMINLFFFNIFKKEKPDIIIVSSLSLFPVLNAYIWSKIFKIEFIFEVRDIWPLSLIELGNISKKHPLVILLNLFEKLGYKKARFVVSLLPDAKDHMHINGMCENKFIHIPNGINLQEVENYQEIDASLKNEIPKNKFIVGYLGTIGIANALEYFVKSAKKLKEHKNIHFVIVGKGGEKEKLENYCFEEKLSNVTFLNPIPKKQVQSMLNLFDICYIGWYNHPIYKLGISANKIFDYMYSGKPILHSISVDNDIVTKAKCGKKVNAEDTNEIAEKILEFYTMSQEELDIFGKNGKDYVITNHTYENLAKKFMKLI